MQIRILQFFRKAKKKSYGIFDSGKHSVHWGMNPPPQKQPPPTLSCQAPPLHFKSTNCPSPAPPFLGSPTLYIGFL